MAVADRLHRLPAVVGRRLPWTVVGGTLNGTLKEEGMIQKAELQKQTVFSISSNRFQNSGKIGEYYDASMD